jgi:hypothetical protein
MVGLKDKADMVAPQGRQLFRRQPRSGKTTLLSVLGCMLSPNMGLGPRLRPLHPRRLIGRGPMPESPQTRSLTSWCVSKPAPMPKACARI